MGSPCEVQVDSPDLAVIGKLGTIAREEAMRIERKFSRYRDDSTITKINRSEGKPVRLDGETAALIDYAQSCYTMSGGLFDITSGILRKAWTFDGSDHVPDRGQIKRLLPLIGWNKVHWANPILRLPPGMQIDFGGLGKEYAVDLTLARIKSASPAPVLINFGGDLRVSGLRADGGRWRILIDPLDEDNSAAAWLEIDSGAVTTSGDARRFVMRDGVRYGHILDPRTGMPVKDAPRAVTVAAPTCMEAGILSTLAMLHGSAAETFLKSEGIAAWVTR